jgi:hypothetical protein
LITSISSAKRQLNIDRCAQTRDLNKRAKEIVH